MYVIPEPMRKSRAREAGAITILVTLMLLVLLTVWAVAMSKNALREVIITGTSRQGAQVRNLADTGLDWSIYWMTDDTSYARAAPATGTGAKALRDQKAAMVASAQTGILSPVISTADMKTSATGVNPVQRFELFATYMGNIPLNYTQGTVTKTSIDAKSPATVQLWSVRSDGYVEYTGGPTFVHRREAWFTLPPTSSK